MSDLPQGWARSTLGAVAEVVGGVTKDSGKQSDPTYVETPYLRVANVLSGRLDLTNVSTIRVPPSKAESLALQPGDVLLNEGGDRDKLGRGWIWQGQIPGCIHQNHVFRARLHKGVFTDPRLVALYTNSIGRAWCEQHAKQSVNLASISLSTIRQMPIPVPPLAEQRRIVDALDDHLSRLDAAATSLRVAELRIVGLRSRILDHWLGANEAPVVPLGELLREPLRNGHSARASDDGSGIRCLTLTAVTLNAFTAANTKMTVADPDRVRGLWLTPGDILIERSNTPDLVGTAALYEGPADWAIFPDLLIRVRLDERRALGRYIECVLAGAEARQYFRARAKGLAGSMPKIDQGTIEQLPVPLPDLASQARIVEQLDLARDAIHRVEDAIRSGRRQSAGLRVSLLEAAFSGRLVSQDPADESAEVLLAGLTAPPKGFPRNPTIGRRGRLASPVESV